MASRKDSAWLTATALLVAANVLIPLAMATFGQGFFPYKPLLPGLAQYADLGQAEPGAPFDRVVFMVVDALRSDFVYSANSGFQYTQSLIRSGAAVPFTAHATSPTVTMPRIKAITTGSIPSFLDVVLNVNEGDKSSSLAAQDSWLAQMKAKAASTGRSKGKLVLYGDDTWLKLFPETFDRADGTTSFFVSDFTEVDNNVTRHVADELRQDDWGVLVLHYLGLDHIGHKGGPRSPHMRPKQSEMDEIVRQIYEEGLASQPHLASTLLVLAGDHGMNDAGNHGASSAGETSPALVFIAPKLQQQLKGRTDDRVAPLDERDDFQFYGAVEQSDLAPTLGALLGFPTPKNSLGAFIPDFLPLWPQPQDQRHILRQNAQQIRRVLTAALGPEALAVDDATACADAASLSDVEALGCAWQAIVAPQGSDDDAWVEQTTQWLRRAQALMSGMASNYDLPKLGLGLAAAATALGLAVAASMTTALRASSSPWPALVPFAAINGAYGAMMFASSYVEEEHHFWYWAATAFLGAVGWRSLVRAKESNRQQLLAVLAALAALRLARAWNQTGQKFAGAPDVVKTFLQPHPALLWTLVGATYVWTAVQLSRDLCRLQLAPPAAVLPAVGLLAAAALAFKLVFTFEDSPELVGSFARPLLALVRRASGPLTLVTRARLVFGGVAAGVGVVVVARLTRPRVQSGSSALLHLYAVLALTQSRTANIPLFLLLEVVCRFLGHRRSRLTAAETTTAALLLQTASFFALGGTNAISSVDLSSAYNGIAGFDAAAVGLLIFVGNWAAPIYCAMAAVRLLRRSSSSPSPFAAHIALLTVASASATVAVMAACAALRTHLFVWTVFSPKYLYCAAWSLGMHLGVNVGLGSLVWWLGE